jgi:hypothetical protein
VVSSLVPLLLTLTLNLTSPNLTSPTRLHVSTEVGPQSGPLHAETATLHCDGHPRATGFLRTTSNSACRLVRRGTVRRVARQQRSRRLCSQIYGGPQRAHITGTIGDDRIKMTVTRTDGCGTADWDKLEALLGPPDRSR